MFKAKGLGDIKAYEKILIDSVEWKIGPLLSNNTFIVLAELYKEG
jgi:hypothetical protein